MYSENVSKANVNLKRPHYLGSTTSIGYIIWEALSHLKNADGNRQLIIIGDGELTGSYINAQWAATLARDQGVTIHAIGIGTYGDVPFGEFEDGSARYAEYSYNSYTFRKVAEITGGTFHEYESKKQFKEVIKELMK